MKRWLMVVSPAVAIAVVGTLFVLLTDRDPEPLAPLPPSTSTAPASPSPSEGLTGETGSQTPTGPTGTGASTGPTGASEPTGPTRPEEKPTEGEGEAGDEDGSGSQDVPFDPPEPLPTVTLELVVAKGSSSSPRVFNAPVGSTVVLAVTSDGVTDRVVVGDDVLSAKISPSKDAKLTFSVDEAGEVRITLQDAGTLVARIEVG